MVLAWYILPVLTLALIIWRKDLRKAVIWAGILSLPVLLAKPILSQDIAVLASLEGGLGQFILERAVLGFSFGALAAGLYELVLHKRISPRQHPLRPRFILLLAGIVVFLLGQFLLRLPFAVSLSLGLTVDILIILLIRRDLIWDLLFSGLGMGFLYGVIFFLFNRGLAGDLSQFWFTDRILGITLFSLPVEELIVVILFGALFGPLYVAVKDLGEDDLATFDWQHLRPKIVIGQTFLFLFLAGGVVLGQQVLFIPRLIATTPTSGASGVGLRQPIRLVFNRPVDRTQLKITVTPANEGSLGFTNGLLRTHLFRTAIFTPESYWAANQSYALTVTGISNVFGRGKRSRTIHFQTQEIPTISSASITPGQDNVPSCAPLTIFLGQPNDRIADFDFQLSPEVAFDSLLAQDRRAYDLKPKSCFKQGEKYHLTVKRTLVIYAPEEDQVIFRGEPEEVFFLEFKTKGAPALGRQEPAPRGVLTTTKEFRLTFSQAMNQDDLRGKIGLTPTVLGEWRWEDEKTLVYSLKESLAHATEYVVTLKAGTRDKEGGFLDQDLKVSFMTLGSVQVKESSPKNGAGGVATTSAITITFDQLVDHDSALEALAIEPAFEREVSWQETKLVIKPKELLTKDATYTVMVKAGVKSLHGLPSTSSFNLKFKTEQSTVLLAIPLDYQDKPLSCEAGALKMALNYKGAAVSEDAIMAIIGYDPTPRGAKTWGDPDVAFVGNINGKQNSSGYGVHWDPVAKAANQFRSAKAFTGWGVTDLAREIAAGNPVVVWGVIGAAYFDPWTTPAGKQVNGWKGEHARTVIGFKGSPENPEQFILNDPIVGRITWSSSRLAGDWGKFGHSGVVVY